MIRGRLTDGSYRGDGNGAGPVGFGRTPGAALTTDGRILWKTADRDRRSEQATRQLRLTAFH